MILAFVICMKLALIALLCKIAVIDFTRQKIGNDDVLALLAIASPLLFADWLRGADPIEIGLALIAALVMFVSLIPFWLLGKIGAGDVKLLAVAPLVTGGADLLLFAIVLLVAAAATALVVKNPILLPEGLFRHYIQHFDSKRVVPFGVPISAALIAVLVRHLGSIVGAVVI